MVWLKQFGWVLIAIYERWLFENLCGSPDWGSLWSSLVVIYISCYLLYFLKARTIILLSSPSTYTSPVCSKLLTASIAASNILIDYYYVVGSVKLYVPKQNADALTPVLPWILYSIKILSNN